MVIPKSVTITFEDGEVIEFVNTEDLEILLHDAKVGTCLTYVVMNPNGNSCPCGGKVKSIEVI